VICASKQKKSYIAFNINGVCEIHDQLADKKAGIAGCWCKIIQACDIRVDVFFFTCDMKSLNVIIGPARYNGTYKTYVKYATKLYSACGKGPSTRAFGQGVLLSQSEQVRRWSCFVWHHLLISMDVVYWRKRHGMDVTYLVFGFGVGGLRVSPVKVHVIRDHSEHVES
jgi:hypothetical protein